MNLEQIKTLINTILSVLATLGIFTPFLTQNNIVSISGALAGVVFVGWQLWTQRKSAQIANVAAMPEVDVVKVKPEAVDLAIKADVLAGSKGDVKIS